MEVLGSTDSSLFFTGEVLVSDLDFQRSQNVSPTKAP